MEKQKRGLLPPHFTSTLLPSISFPPQGGGEGGVCFGERNGWIEEGGSPDHDHTTKASDVTSSSVSCPLSRGGQSEIGR